MPINDITAPYEYVVPQANEGKYKKRRILMLIGYILFLPVIFALMLTLPFGKLMIPLMCLGPIALWIIVFFTWRYVSIEYEYSVVSGRVTFAVVYGGRTRKEKLTFALKDCSVIAPLDGENKSRLDSFSPDTVYNALPKEDDEDGYFAAFTDENGKRIAFKFEATNKMISLCKLHNLPATTAKKVRY